MKITILTLILASLISCTTRIDYAKPVVVVSVTKRICCDICCYNTGINGGEFYDSCGKFNIGDTITTTKKKNK